jgi:hypothetical protein
MKSLISENRPIFKIKLKPISKGSYIFPKKNKKINPYLEVPPNRKKIKKIKNKNKNKNK